jgi:malate dehydrogenase (oxaloacetate-decarboxylating)(NADP+)
MSVPSALEPRADGARLLADPVGNKGTAFTEAERDALGIGAFLPPRVESLEEQAARIVANVQAAATPLDKYRCLSGVRDTNETLFYRVMLDHLEEMLPIVYTPTVGQACVEWSRIFERPRGLYLSASRHRGRIAGLLAQWPRRPVGIIVVTDGGRILGLGDLGANGMGIPVGKLSPYTACAGVPPELGLPITIDVGTDNATLRASPFYLGERAPRLTGPGYDSLLDEFVSAAQQVFPGVVVQFEDFNNAAAFGLLERHRATTCCFNDDVQGTGAMGLAGLYSACRLLGARLSDQRVLFAGCGEACLGIGTIVVAAMMHEGLSEQDARARCLFVDSRGLVVAGRTDLTAYKHAVAHDRPWLPDVHAAVEVFAPTVLVGASGQGGLFARPVLEAMGRLNARPVVFALSNPTSKAECTAAQAYEWTSGRAVFASGSPFEPITVGGRLHVPGQANNAYVFPGVGLGLLLARATRVTDGMFFAAARALADLVTDDDLRQGRIFPAASRLRDVALAVATAVAAVAWEQGCATGPRPADLRAEATRFMYVPRYRSSSGV